MNREKHNLLAYITQVSFAMDDTVLFLDTHPCDKDALCYYNKLKKEREEAVNEYTQKYGPLSKYDVPDSCYWEWVKTRGHGNKKQTIVVYYGFFKVSVNFTKNKYHCV